MNGTSGGMTGVILLQKPVKSTVVAVFEQDLQVVQLGGAW
jgi:hypothetical protein